MKFRLPMAVDFRINAFSGAVINELESGITNGVIENVNGRKYLTQRPSIDVFEDASAKSAGSRGRALFYWEGNSALYILNDGTLYKNSQSNSISTSPTAGTKKCKFLVLDDVMCLIDTENSEAWTITMADNVVAISDGEFPPNLGTPVDLAYGGTVLNGYLFVMGDNGVIYNSVNGNMSSWLALDFVDAERSVDGGAYLGKHHDNIVALGIETIEFFYDAANTTGSPLNRRQDVSYNIGCTSGETVWEIGDRMFFIGTNASGALGVYTIQEFDVRKISNSTIDSFITQAIAKDDYLAVGSGLSAQGHIFYTLTIYTAPTDITPDITLVYDDTSGLWGEWETTINGLTNFPLIGWTVRQGVIPRYGEGILANGDLITLNDDMDPNDTLLAFKIVEDGILEGGIVEQASEASTPIKLIARLGQYDAKNDNMKFTADIRYVGDRTATAQNLIIRWANENSASFSTGITIDTSKFSRVRRCGKFRRRNTEIEYSGTEVIRIEALEGNLMVGRN